MKNKGMFILLALLMCSCAASPQRIANNRPAVSNRYYDPTGTFSVSAAQNLSSTRVVEHSDENYKSASFISDFGSFTGVQVVRCPEGIRPIIETNSEAAFKYLDAVYKLGVIDPLTQKNPGTIAKHEENLILDQIGPAKFVILSIPGGSSIASAETGRKLDSTQSYLLSFCEDYVVIITHQNSPVFSQIANDIGTGGDGEARNQKMLNELVEIRSSYKDESSASQANL